MTPTISLLAPAAKTFENALTRPKPAAPLAPAKLLLAGLLVAALVPRLLMAARVDVLCPDGVFYICVADALEQGNLEQGLAPTHLNTYPLALAALHHAGVPWERAGKLYGVLLSTLVVLPLFGWLRRMFDDRVATVACLLYAAHPKLVAWSPELVREPGFWFFWTLSLYLLWRAVTEARLLWFAAAGVAVTLAVNTRFEGWFLFSPLLLWSAWRLRAAITARRRLVYGVAVCAAMGPLLMVTLNLTWLRNQSQWELGSFQRLEWVAQWGTATWNSARGAIGLEKSPPAKPTTVAAAPAAGAKVAPASPLPPPSVVSMFPDEPLPTDRPLGSTLWKFLHVMERSMFWCYGLLFLWGTWKWRKAWLRNDQQPLFLAALAVLAGIWIHLWYAQASSSRYGLTIAILATPFAALGIMGLAEVLARWRPAQRTVHYQQALIALLLIATLAGWVDALSNREPLREHQAAIGRWALREHGPKPKIAVGGRLAIVSYYAQTQPEVIPLYAKTEQATSALAKTTADVAVLSRKLTPPPVMDALLAKAQELHFEPVSAQRLGLKGAEKDLLVLERQPHVARQSTPAEAR